MRSSSDDKYPFMITSSSISGRFHQHGDAESMSKFQFFPKFKMAAGENTTKSDDTEVFFVKRSLCDKIFSIKRIYSCSIHYLCAKTL